MKAHVSKNSFTTIKSKSGDLYVCPFDIVKSKKGKISDKELKKLCIDDSLRPWND